MSAKASHRRQPDITLPKLRQTESYTSSGDDFDSDQRIVKVIAQKESPIIKPFSHSKKSSQWPSLNAGLQPISPNQTEAPSQWPAILSLAVSSPAPGQPSLPVLCSRHGPSESAPAHPSNCIPSTERRFHMGEHGWLSGKTLPDQTVRGSITQKRRGTRTVAARSLIHWYSLY